MPEYEFSDYDFIEGSTGEVAGFWVKTEEMTQKGMIGALLAKHRMYDLLRKFISGEYTVKPNTLDNNGGYFIIFMNQSNKTSPSRREATYEGDKYLIFDSVQDFTDEIKKSSKAILLTSFDKIRSQIVEVKEVLAPYYRTPSELVNRLLDSKMYCANNKCEVTFSKHMLSLLLIPTDNYIHVIGNIPRRCPKCNAVEIYLLIKL